MQINDNLNLVLTLRENEDGVEIYAFHTPITKEVYKINAILLAATNTEMGKHGEDFQLRLGPRLASQLLVEADKAESRIKGLLDENGEPKTNNSKALLNEIKRRTTVLVATDKGYENLPVDVAIKNNHIFQEEWDEVESDLVFFTCHYFLAKIAKRNLAGEVLASHLKGLRTSSTPTEFINSLQKSTTEEPSKLKTA